MFGQLLVEALVVGITVIVFWLLANFIASVFSFSSVVTLPVLTVLFITGVSSHLFFEAVGLNKWYCKNGHACHE